MKALSLWQPYASAVALGLKTYETRSWTTKVRGPITIHASKRWGPAERDLSRNAARIHGQPLLAEPPLGAIVAIAEIAEVFRTEDIREKLSADELFFGDYDDGRYAWRLENVRALRTPIPIRGWQGFFPVPDELLTGIVLSNPLNSDRATR